MISAAREFNEHGYVWYPQIWVESLGRWVELSWVRVHCPEGFKSPDAAIHFASLGA